MAAALGPDAVAPSVGPPAMTETLESTGERLDLLARSRDRKKKQAAAVETTSEPILDSESAVSVIRSDRDRVQDAGPAVTAVPRLPRIRKPRPLGLDNSMNVDDSQDVELAGGDGSDDQTSTKDAVEHAASDELPQKRHKKKKKKRRSRSGRQKGEQSGETVNDLVGTSEILRSHPTQAWANIHPDDIMDGHHSTTSVTEDTNAGETLNTTRSSTVRAKRQTIGVVSGGGFRRVSQRTLEMQTTSEIDVGHVESRGHLGPRMVQIWVEKSIRTVFRFSLAVTLGFSVASQLFVNTLFDNDEYDRFVEVYHQMSMTMSAFYFVLLVLSLASIFDSITLDGLPAGQKFYLKPSDTLGALCLLIATVVSLVIAKTDIQLDRYGSYSCPQFLNEWECSGGAAVTERPQVSKLSPEWVDIIDNWHNMNVARLVAICVCGFGVLLV